MPAVRDLEEIEHDETEPVEGVEEDREEQKALEHAQRRRPVELWTSSKRDGETA